EKVDLSKYIEIRNNRPNIRGRRIPIIFIVSAKKAHNATIDELCENYTLSHAQVLAALLYYEEHQAELDAQDEADTAESIALYERYKRDYERR
ncbi:MAG: DUF433 domain-containing protein, partial [Anaerolineae bacterium]|nr:DUF433 domain-containing protein [Anaerolineae bacterium]